MSASAELLPLVMAIIALGVGAQVLAGRFRVPIVLFLILAGIAAGPEGLDFVAHDSFGDARITILIPIGAVLIIFSGMTWVSRRFVERIQSARS